MTEDNNSIEDIFIHKTLFEKEVFDVNSEKERAEVMKILAHKIVDIILKEHLNFTCIKQLSDFTLKHITNILFKEIASEWMYYSMEVYGYTKEKALEEIQPKERIVFIHQIAEEYYRYYKDYIFENIANSFIDLLASMNKGSEKIILVNSVINSDLMANRNIIGINSFDQLYKRIVSAKGLKSASISQVQIKISDLAKELVSDDVTQSKKEDLSIVLPKYEERVKKLQNTNLEEFDHSLKRVKMAIFNSLKSGVFKN